MSNYIKVKDQKTKIETLGQYGALLSLIEVGLGSILHSFRIPFSGFFLSMNQGYLLCRISILTGDKTMPMNVSNIAAILKSLSPAGNKLGPMLSLSMQGLLFSIGTLFGINILGVSIGMILLSFWGFIQPLITYYMFFGEEIVHAADFLIQKIGIKTELVFEALVAIVIVKAMAGVVLAIFAFRANGKSDFQDKLVLIKKTKTPASGTPIKLALKDLMKPFFLFSLTTTAVFLYFSQHAWSEIIWYLLRPLAVGFIFFYFSRTLTLDRLLVRLYGGKFETFAKGCEVALAKVRKVI